MKNKIFGGIAILAIAVIAAFNVNLNTNNEVSLLTLANVEALAGESNDGKWHRDDMDCVYSVEGKVGSYVTILSIKIKVGADGYARYTCENCKTECSTGGTKQCESKYFQQII